MEEIEQQSDDAAEATQKNKIVITAADIIINPFTYSHYKQENSDQIDQINVMGIPDEQRQSK